MMNITTKAASAATAAAMANPVSTPLTTGADACRGIGAREPGLGAAVGRGGGGVVLAAVAD